MVNQVDLVSETLRSLVALLFAAVVVMGSPGPSTVSATAMGASYGVRRSLKYAWGLIAGTVAVLLLVSTGVTAFVMSMPSAARILNIVSALYILYLAYRIATAPPLDKRAENLSSPAFKGDSCWPSPIRRRISRSARYLRERRSSRLITVSMPRPRSFCSA